MLARIRALLHLHIVEREREWVVIYPMLRCCVILSLSCTRPLGLSISHSVCRMISIYMRRIIVSGGYYRCNTRDLKKNHPITANEIYCIRLIYIYICVCIVIILYYIEDNIPRNFKYRIPLDNTPYYPSSSAYLRRKNICSREPRITIPSALFAPGLNTRVR